MPGFPTRTGRSICSPPDPWSPGIDTCDGHDGPRTLGEWAQEGPEAQTGTVAGMTPTPAAIAGA